jgi:cytosine/uracil/thiamine/allantoin permease
MPSARPETRYEQSIAARTTRLQRDIGIVAWTSFAAAIVGSGLCFALVDPLSLAFLHEADPALGRMTGYAVGFFLFWLATALAGAFTMYLVRTERPGDPGP